MHAGQENIGRYSMTQREIDNMFGALIVLLGEEGVDYWKHERDPEEWQLVLWIHRN